MTALLALAFPAAIHGRGTLRPWLSRHGLGPSLGLAALWLRGRMP